MIVFLDANALIYLIEGAEPFAGRVRARLAGVEREFPGARLALSRLSWLECRIRPMRRNEPAVLAAYDTFFARPDLIWVELDKNVVELATAIRARHGLRTPDALQAACCLQLGPEHRLFSGDAMFGRVAGLNVEVLE